MRNNNLQYKAPLPPPHQQVPVTEYKVDCSLTIFCFSLLRLQWTHKVLRWPLEFFIISQNALKYIYLELVFNHLGVKL